MDLAYINKLLARELRYRFPQLILGLITVYLLAYAFESMLFQVKSSNTPPVNLTAPVTQTVGGATWFDKLASFSAKLFGTSSASNEADFTDAIVSSSPTTYTVQAGDSLWSIAQEKLGSGYRYTDIIALNTLDNPNVIHTGTVITLPQQPEGTITPVAAMTQNTTVETQHTVTQGESLSQIAHDVYGAGDKWELIAKANTIMNPNLIYPGVVLTIPAVQSSEVSYISPTPSPTIPSGP